MYNSNLCAKSKSTKARRANLQLYKSFAFVITLSTLLTACIAIPNILNPLGRPRPPLRTAWQSPGEGQPVVPLVTSSQPGVDNQPTLADFWNGEAEFKRDIEDTGLPMGESETILMTNGELWSYVHASERSAGVVDKCGEPVPFPGCVVIYRSLDAGRSFVLDPPVCQIGCISCPCTSNEDHINQQQYPRVAYDGRLLHLVYEFGAMSMARVARDGLNWSPAEQVPWTGIWVDEQRDCPDNARINAHPFVEPHFDCLVGAPPGIFIHDSWIYIFVAMGQNPGAMGCYYGRVEELTQQMVVCKQNPLFIGVSEYGPLEEKGPHTNQFFTFRTISSAEVVQIENRFYMLFEGVRGPGPGDPGDTQFALGLARSRTAEIDGPWELYPHNPILVDLPGNIGLGHADLVVVDGQTLLYTSLDGRTRSRLQLVWNRQS